MRSSFVRLLLPPTPLQRELRDTLVECGWKPLSAHWFVEQLWWESKWYRRRQMLMDIGCDRETAEYWLEYHGLGEEPGVIQMRALDGYRKWNSSRKKVVLDE